MDESFRPNKIHISINWLFGSLDLTMIQEISVYGRVFSPRLFSLYFYPSFYDSLKTDFDFVK